MKAISILALFMLAACDRDRPPAPTSGQHAKLDEAEDMLNDMAANEEGAAPEDTAPPSNQQG
jgi:hypothetical protein